MKYKVMVLLNAAAYNIFDGHALEYSGIVHDSYEKAKAERAEADICFKAYILEVTK